MGDPRKTHDDAAMMGRPDLWPVWPRLPLKRGNIFKDGNVGVLIDHAAYRYVVFLASMFDRIDFATTPQLPYDSFESVVADGWLVD